MIQSVHVFSVYSCPSSCSDRLTRCRQTAGTRGATRAEGGGWGAACGACMSRQNRRSKWIWRGVMRGGAGLGPRFHSHIIKGEAAPSPELTNALLCPRKDGQGQSPRRRLMRGDRWEEELQTSLIKLTFFRRVCVFLLVFLHREQIHAEQLL